jgi:anti-sigma factor RsiW
MTCDSAQTFLSPFLDEELDANHMAEIQSHVDECEGCSKTLINLRRVNEALHDGLERQTAPTHLEAKIRSMLRDELRTSRPSMVWKWAAVAAGVLLAASLSVNMALLNHRGAVEPEMTREVVASHVRSLVGAHLLDVESTDQHTVKPFFQGKLDFAPDVRDFAPQGFPLVGGRVDFVGGRRVAALIYRRGGHVMNVFEWPESGNGDSLTELSNDGFHSMRWSRAGMRYWAISDVNADALKQFAGLWR